LNLIQYNVVKNNCNITNVIPPSTSRGNPDDRSATRPLRFCLCLFRLLTQYTTPPRNLFALVAKRNYTGQNCSSVTHVCVTHATIVLVAVIRVRPTEAMSLLHVYEPGLKCWNNRLHGSRFFHRLRIFGNFAVLIQF
jgi:hypothetical protein